MVIGPLAAERDSALLFEFGRGRLEPTVVMELVPAIGMVADELPGYVPQQSLTGKKLTMEDTEK